MNCDQVSAILKRAEERGMTLLEMMVALLISSLLILGIVNVYRFAYNDWTDGMMVERLQQQTQSTMGWLENDVKQAVITTVAGETTVQAPIMTTENANGDDGYGVIIITSDQSGLHQVNYQLIPWNNQWNSSLLQLQRSVTTYSYPLISLSDPSLTTQWTTLLTGITTMTTTPFSVSTFDVTTYTHPSLTITSLTVQEPNAVRTTTQSGAIIQLNTTLTMRGNSQLQDEVLEGQ